MVIRKLVKDIKIEWWSRKDNQYKLKDDGRIQRLRHDKDARVRDNFLVWTCLFSSTVVVQRALSYGSLQHHHDATCSTSSMSRTTEACTSAKHLRGSLLEDMAFNVARSILFTIQSHIHPHLQISPYLFKYVAKHFAGSIESRGPLNESLLARFPTIS